VIPEKIGRAVDSLDIQTEGITRLCDKTGWRLRIDAHGAVGQWMGDLFG
jgi:hypothetical protein